MDEYCDIIHGVNYVYEEYAKKAGLSYTTLYIMMMIDRIRDCTQKAIAEVTLLPKQTINSVITNLYDKGCVELTELKEDRRAKVISYTDEGRKYIGAILKKISKAEQAAMDSLPEEQKQGLIDLTKMYADRFRGHLLGDETE